MTEQPSGGLVRPSVSPTDAVAIARECYGIDVAAHELGSNQDRNFVLEEPDGARSVLRVDNPVFSDAERDAQHAALEAYRAAGVPVADVLPGLDGDLTQRWGGFSVRRSAFAQGESMVDLGYFAPVVLEEFGVLAAASVKALATLEHPGLERQHMWVMASAHAETVKLAESITDEDLRARVLQAADSAAASLEPLVQALPVQAIHGDLTDDNVTGLLRNDSRVHPHTVLDLGDLAYGWRVSELAVTASSMLHHEPDRPLRVLDTIEVFHREAPLSAAEARAVWPLILLRACVLVASGWHQLIIDGDNDYARERIAGEQAIFDSATALSLTEMTEHVLARLGYIGVAHEDGLRLAAVSGTGRISHAGDANLQPLASLLPALSEVGSGSVVMLDPGVESDDLDAGTWLEHDAELGLVAAAAAKSASVPGSVPGPGTAPAPAAAILPYGVYRLTRTEIDCADAAETWPIGTEVWVAPGESLDVVSPAAGTLSTVTERGVLISLDDEWHLSIDGVNVQLSEGTEVTAGAALGHLPASNSVRPIAVTLCRSDVLKSSDALGDADVAILAVDVPDIGRAQLITPERVPAWSRFTHDPAALLGLESRVQRDESGAELARRENIFASAQERYYDRPMQIERGWRHHLIDTTGRAYVDIVNNVSGIGHGHPGVADAMNRQSRLLNTNSRFLYRSLAEYSERLLSLLPDDSEIDTLLLVNSGSEAVDLAIRLAQAATGRKTIVSLREAYHGWTMASDAVTTSVYDNPSALATRPGWVHVADAPNRFRGTYIGDANDASIGQQYASDLGRDLEQLAENGRQVAGFICESVLGNAGGVLLPEGYLTDVYARVRAAGGLCIADEVQVGFGRMGSSFWGFEQSNVRPDIVTIAKPMGNGFPIGGVMTSTRIADALANEGQFFSSAGGNPLSCQVGLAVLDAMESEALQENARVVGSRLAGGFRALAKRHEIIGPIHGEGLYLGVELVRDRGTLEPADAEAAGICERLRELGVIVLTTSERSNVLKVKPPLTLTPESADFVLAMLDRVLTEGW